MEKKRMVMSDIAPNAWPKDVTEASYLYFRLEEERTTTKVWTVVNKENGSRLGKISWYGPWRKYAFFTIIDSVFESVCLHDISEFLAEETGKFWKKKRLTRK